MQHFGTIPSAPPWPALQRVLDEERRVSAPPHRSRSVAWRHGWDTKAEASRRRSWTMSCSCSPATLSRQIASGTTVGARGCRSSLASRGRSGIPEVASAERSGVPTATSIMHGGPPLLTGLAGTLMREISVFISAPGGPREDVAGMMLGRTPCTFRHIEASQRRTLQVSPGSGPSSGWQWKRFSGRSARGPWHCRRAA